MKIRTALLILFIGMGMYAQEKVKVDGVATVVGDNIVLNSEIDAFKQELIQQSGGQIEISDCEMLEQIMNRKLLAHHAVIDSIVVNEGEIQQQVQRKTDYFTQFGFLFSKNAPIPSADSGLSQRSARAATVSSINASVIGAPNDRTSAFASATAPGAQFR